MIFAIIFITALSVGFYLTYKCDDFVSIATGILLIFSGMFGLASNIYELSYKKGQVDAINGEIKYELQTNPDSTTTWIKIKSK